VSALVVLAPLAKVEFDPVKEFIVHPYVDLPFGLGISKAVIYLWMSAALACGVTLLVVRRGLRVKPDRGQTALEYVYEVCEEQIAKQGLPREGMRIWFPYVATLFFFIWAMNLIGFVPLPFGTQDKVDVFGLEVPQQVPARGRWRAQHTRGRGLAMAHRHQLHLPEHLRLLRLGQTFPEYHGVGARQAVHDRCWRFALAREALAEDARGISKGEALLEPDDRFQLDLAPAASPEDSRAGESQPDRARTHDTDGREWDQVDRRTTWLSERLRPGCVVGLRRWQGGCDSGEVARGLGWVPL
jgi:hypothetical protein